MSHFLTVTLDSREIGFFYWYFGKIEMVKVSPDFEYPLKGLSRFLLSLGLCHRRIHVNFYSLPNKELRAGIKKNYEIKKTAN
tara:strand:+ start:436 stop:681 length:246 start_codon:yes stop_codon:yes gene_type:complete